MKPRIRSIKPEFFTHTLLYDVEQATLLPIRVGYAGLWAWSDRAGLFEWKPRELKLGIAPYDPCDFEHVMNALAWAAFIFKYVHDGRVYGCIPRWLYHQQINNRESPSILPKPTARAFTEHDTLLMRADWHLSLARELLLSDPPILGGSIPHTDSDLASRDARDDPRVPDVPRPEQNRTEQNRTKVQPPVGEYVEHVRTGISGEGLDVRPADESGGYVFIGPDGADVAKSIEHAAFSSDGVYTSDARAEPTPRKRALPALQGKPTASNLMARLATVLDEVRSGARERVAREQVRQLQAEFIFTYWANVHDHLNAVMDAKRVQRIVARLDENKGDVSELLYAVDGAKRDKQLMGANDRNTRYDGIQTLFRDREMIERCAARMPKYRANEPHGMLEKWGAIVADFNRGNAK